MKFVPSCNSNGKTVKCGWVTSVRNACAERVSQQIYQSHAGPRLRLHLTLKNSLVKFSNPNEKLVELCEPRYHATAKVFKVRQLSMDLQEEFEYNGKFSVCKNFIKSLLSIKRFFYRRELNYNCLTRTFYSIEICEI